MKKNGNNEFFFLRFDATGYVTYIYFILMILPILYTLKIPISDWETILVISFGGIPIGATLGYILFNFYDLYFEPTKQNKYFGLILMRRKKDKYNGKYKSQRYEYLFSFNENGQSNYKARIENLDLIFDYSHVKSEKETINLLRRRWAIFDNRMILGFFSPIVSSLMILLTLPFIYSVDKFSFNIFNIDIIWLLYYVLLTFLIIGFSLWNIRDSYKKYREADQIELLALMRCKSDSKFLKLIENLDKNMLGEQYIDFKNEKKNETK